MRDTDGYVLRDRDETEVERLRFQHEVWREVSDAALDSAAFAAGDLVADLGCGPGFLAMDLAGRVAPGGRVLAVDRSKHFVEYLRQRARREQRAEVEPRVGDIAEPHAGAGSLDGAVCRWVLMFVSDPASVIASVFDALRPGGRFLAIEYFQFRSIALHPPSPAFARVYGAVHRHITESGGDPDIGGRLPTLMHAAGLEVAALWAVLKTGRPGSREWAWLEGTHANHPGLVEAGFLSDRELDDYHTEWDRASADPAAFFSGPPVVVITARKPA